MSRGLRVTRTSGTARGVAPAQQGHVTIVLEPPPDAPPALTSWDWDRVHIVLAAWKARRLLAEARSHMELAARHPTAAPGDFASGLEEALAATTAALQALDRVR